MIGTQIHELERKEAAEIARQNEQRRADLASKYARLLAKESPTGDDVAAIFDLAKGLGRSAADVDSDRKAILAWQKHAELLPEREVAQHELEKASDAVTRAKSRLLQLEDKRGHAMQVLSTLNMTLRELPRKCEKSCLFTVEGRSVEPRFNKGD